MQIKQPDIRLVEEALAADGVVAPYGDWMEKAIVNLGIIIQKSPRNYRNYGPFWYRIKRMLIAYGFDYEEDFEGDIIAADIPDHVVLASGIVLSEQQAYDAVFSNTHQLETTENETYSYALEDSEMEVLIMEKAAVNL